MATYVLVHGAWGGGWYWCRTARLLRAAGHDVLTPTLTGLGERKHLLMPSVGLETHIQDILQVLRHERLSEVVLVGHSYRMIKTGELRGHNKPGAVAGAGPWRVAVVARSVPGRP
jgi:pimeloyl-ACP methyl ester carboxylesterase